MMREFGGHPWPKTMHVPADTYDAVEAYLQAIKAERVAEWRAAGEPVDWHEDLWPIYVGPNYGVMLKNVELIRHAS